MKYLKPVQLLIFCGVFLCCFLGYWQTERYRAKKMLLKAAAHSQSGPVQNFSTQVLPQTLPEFSRILVRGKYINNMTLLVQNKMHAGQPGMEVFTPFLLKKDEQRLLLIDRGWIPVTQSTQSLYSAVSSQVITVRGHLRKASGYQFILGKNIADPHSRPLIMQKIDIKEINHLLQKKFYPFVLRLDAEMPDGFVRDWQVVTLLPQQHLAYAIQWYLLAGLLALLSIRFVLKQRKPWQKNLAKK